MKKTKTNISYWEYRQWFDDVDYIIIGGGIVGLSTAIETKTQERNKKVLVIEKGTWSFGASTANAGFACFGSISEIADDMENFGVETSVRLIEMRIKGLELLLERLGKGATGYQNNGGAEIFFDKKEADRYLGLIPQYNDIVYRISGKKDTYSLRKGPFGPEIFNRHEGSINTQMMMDRLTRVAVRSGVRILYGTEVECIDAGQKTISFEGMKVDYKHLIVCTNGFSGKLFKASDINIPLTPARNQVLVTHPVRGFSLGPCYHMERGYVYFREIDGRLLIGGGRHLDFEGETTTESGFTDQIMNYLVKIASEMILPGEDIKIAYRWSGILGTADTKMPVLEALPGDVTIATRMGGMGVAIGSYLGREAAKMVLENEE